MREDDDDDEEIDTLIDEQRQEGEMSGECYRLE